MIDLKIMSRKSAKATGLAHYFTGTPCKAGHFSKRNTRSGNCLMCEAARMYRRYLAAPEAARAQVKRSYARRRDMIRARRSKRCEVHVPDLPGEEWRDIPGYERIYAVSSLGRVKRLAHAKGATPGQLLKPRFWGKDSGYLMIQLLRNSHQRTHTIHELVALAFIGPKPSGMEVNHKNGKKIHNDATNLEYVTSAQNTLHAYRVLGHKYTGLRGAENGFAKLIDERVLAIRQRIQAGESLASIARAESVSPTTIGDIKHKRTWTHLL